MGAPDTYELSGSYNDCYRAMGDAVAVPVTRWLARHLLAPLVARAVDRGLDSFGTDAGLFSDGSLFHEGIGSLENG
jgi:hypothetical protein